MASRHPNAKPIGAEPSYVVSSLPTLVVDTTTCSVSWPGCRETYNGVHTCDRKQRHDGRHRCVCGATKARKR